MKTTSTKLTAVAFGVALGLTACGGGGGGSAASPGSVTTQGVITGFGSVFVNGVEYETGGADIAVEGGASSEDALGVGMVVTVTGSVNADGRTGTATSIAFADEVEGIVLSNSVGADGTGSMDVMGQTVEVDAGTVFESSVASIAAPEQVQAGNIVEVSGYSSGMGTIYATRIEVKAQSMAGVSAIEVKGLISNVDTDAMTFTIGSLTVDYSGASLRDLPNAVPEADLFVEVKSDQALSANGALVATAVELENEGDREHDGDEGDELELRGRITDGFASGQFTVNGHTVLVNSGTEFENGGDSSLLTMGTMVEVEGSLDADDSLVADEIGFESESDIELEANLEAVGSDSITLMHQTISVDNNTMMVDSQDEGSAQPVRYFDLADLSSGDRVEVHLYRNAAGGLVATKIERDDDHGSSYQVEGPVEAVSGTDIVVAGITIDVSGVSGFTPAVDDAVEVEGTFAGGVLAATSGALDD